MPVLMMFRIFIASVLRSIARQLRLNVVHFAGTPRRTASTVPHERSNHVVSCGAFRCRAEAVAEHLGRESPIVAFAVASERVARRCSTRKCEREPCGSDLARSAYGGTCRCHSRNAAWCSSPTPLGASIRAWRRRSAPSGSMRDRALESSVRAPQWRQNRDRAASHAGRAGATPKAQQAAASARAPRRGRGYDTARRSGLRSRSRT